MAVLVESRCFQAYTTPVKSSQSSSQAYILSIASLPDHYAASASPPSNIIDVFDKFTLQGIQTLAGHEEAITSLHSVKNVAGISNVSLMSSGKDGSVKIWDERSNSHSIKMTNLGGSRSLLCCDLSPDGLTVAAGTDLQGDEALIIYWDPRQPATPLRIHSSTHSDDVTALSFLKSSESQPALGQHHILLSASSDGLINTSNADEDDEDDAVLHVGNWGCSVSQTGWMECPSGPKIWAASDMETFSTWSDELDQLQSLDIRNPSVHNTGRTWVTDYLITCVSNRKAEFNLGVFVGSNEGDVALLSNANLSVPNAPWYLHKVWTNGHAGVVRSLFWDDDNNVLITGGEDNNIHAWPCVFLEDGSESVSMNVDTPSRKRGLGMGDRHDGKKARR